jgi:hypothetical protein
MVNILVDGASDDMDRDDILQSTHFWQILGLTTDWKRAPKVWNQYFPKTRHTVGIMPIPVEIHHVPRKVNKVVNGVFIDCLETFIFLLILIYTGETLKNFPL